jgi:uncharacterized damage-inducible protein DinB
VETRDPKVFLDYLASVHARTQRVIACIPENDLDWSPAPGWFSFGDLIRHLAGIERYMYGESAAGRPNAYPGHGRDLADGLDATLAYYRRCHEESVEIFSRLTGEALAQRVRTPAGSSISLWKWLRAMLEHEAHHRGQMYLMLAMRGVATPPIYGLTSEQVRDLALDGGAQSSRP